MEKLPLNKLCGAPPERFSAAKKDYIKNNKII
jgi:hypothetical protein